MFGTGDCQRGALRPNPPGRRHLSGDDAQPGRVRHRQRRHARARVAADDRRGRSELRRARPRSRRDASTRRTSLTTRSARARGRHTMKFGGEYRHFINENFAEGTGAFNFPDVAAFLAGTANSFSITLGERRSVIDQRALGVVRPGPDRARRRPHARSRAALRMARHADRAGRSLRRLRRGERVAGPRRRRRREIYQQNNSNVEPRARRRVEPRRPTAARSLRAAYGQAVDQPGTTAVRDTAGNPPFGVPLTATGSIPLASAHRRGAAGGPGAGHGRSRVPQRVAAVLERQPAAGADARPGRDARLLRVAAARTCASRGTSTSR